MFDPTQHGFHHFDLAFETLHFFARRPDINTREARLNQLTVFLTQDGDFVTVWFGLFDAGISESVFKDKLPKLREFDIDFNVQYHESLFRGYIKDKQTAKTILSALRLDNFKDQELLIEDDQLHCELADPAL